MGAKADTDRYRPCSRRPVTHTIQYTRRVGEQGGSRSGKGWTQGHRAKAGWVHGKGTSTGFFRAQTRAPWPPMECPEMLCHDEPPKTQAQHWALGTREQASANSNHEKTARRRAVEWNRGGGVRRVDTIASNLRVRNGELGLDQGWKLFSDVVVPVHQTPPETRRQESTWGCACVHGGGRGGDCEQEGGWGWGGGGGGRNAVGSSPTQPPAATHMR
jgi:hypothetical protein